MHGVTQPRGLGLLCLGAALALALRPRAALSVGAGGPGKKRILRSRLQQHEEMHFCNL